MSIDYTGIPSSQCPECTSRRFKTWIIVDTDDYEIGIYGTDGECADCGIKYTIATPPEHPDLIEEEIDLSGGKDEA